MAANYTSKYTWGGKKATKPVAKAPAKPKPSAASQFTGPNAPRGLGSGLGGVNSPTAASPVNNALPNIFNPNGPMLPSPLNTNPLIEGVYTDATGDNYNTYNNAGIGISADTTATANDYGFTIDKTYTDPTQYAGLLGGALKSELTVDPSNAFSKMALLQRSYEQAKAGSMNSYGAQGQYSSGAYHRAQENDAFNNAQGNNALRTSFQQVLRDSLKNLGTAQSDYTGSNTLANTNRLNAYLGGN